MSPLFVNSFNSFEFVDSLAEVSSHTERGVIERSLLQTLTDYCPASELRLYRVLVNESNQGLALMAYAKNRVIDTLDYEIRDTTLPDEFSKAINKTIQSHTVQIVPNPQNDDLVHSIYPAKNNNNQIIAIMIQSGSELDSKNQHLIHALLKVYSNYLELIDKARRDKLTQLLNRESLDAEISRILIRNNTAENNILKLPDYSNSDLRRSAKNSVYWLGLVDIDHFEKIKNAHSHLNGDEILILVSRLLDKNIRDYDSAYRFDGEKFVIIIASDNEKTATFAFERIRREINNHPFAEVGNVSISIGITQISNQADPSNIIKEADCALSFANSRGENQVRFYTHLLKAGLIEKYMED